MNTANSVYELQIIKKAIANHLDRILPSDANQALYLIQYQIDDLVWNISTSIYQRSGCKVDFSLVRDLANTRIESLKMLVVRQAEEVKQKALEEEARKIEKARLKAEAEARRKAEEEARKTEEALQKEINKAKNNGTYWQKRKAGLISSDIKVDDFTKEVFFKIREVIAEELKMHPEEITMDSDLEYLGADGCNLYKIALEIEAQFDIELEEYFKDSNYEPFYYASVTTWKDWQVVHSYSVEELLDSIIPNL